MKQIVSVSQAKKIIEKLHAKNKKVVLTGGCFDILHPGHFRLLENAKKQGDVLFVLLESDKKISFLKGPKRPIHSQDERGTMLAGLRFVDFIIPLSFFSDDKSYDELVVELHPDVIATSEHDPNIEHKKRQAEHIGAEVIEVTKYIPHASTSRLVNMLSQEN